MNIANHGNAEAELRSMIKLIEEINPKAVE
jgi:hypothetical protein